MLTKLMRYSIIIFEKFFKGCDFEIRNVYTLEYFEREKRAKFKIEFSDTNTNEYYYVIVVIDDNLKELCIYNFIHC